MGFLASPKLDHGAHFFVAALIGVTFVIPLTNHAGNHIVTGLSAIGLALAGVQAVYHLGLTIAGFGKVENEEIEAGKVARNLLTAGMIVALVATMGQLAGLANAPNPFAEGANQAETDIGMSRGFNMIGLILALVMRFLDLFLDNSHDGDTVNGAGKRFMKSLDVVCAAEMDGEAAINDGIFNARIIMVHLLLVASGVFASIVAGGQNNIKLGTLDKSDAGRNMLAALILIWTHFILYPFAILINAWEPLQNTCIRIHCGKPDKCSTLESWNRIPLFRSMVAGGVLCCLSYVLGSQLGGDSQLSNLLLTLGLYLAADAVGRNVV